MSKLLSRTSETDRRSETLNPIIYGFAPQRKLKVYPILVAGRDQIGRDKQSGISNLWMATRVSQMSLLSINLVCRSTLSASILTILLSTL